MARRFDPTRRDRIVDVTIEAVAELGVAGISARRIAARADVPLGSMTYHFTDMDELLHEAFTRFSLSVATRFEARLVAATTVDEAKQAVATLVLDDLAQSPRELVLTHELYTLAARDARYRSITREWMRRSRSALERHFTPDVSRQLDALIEGLTIHQALDTEPHDPQVTVSAIDAICRGA
ncbi:TetR/AcrR family transcriptional regulator [Sanguibacter inulinus]|uniref:TetR family transcriptional regulator n=1 Tax=Sanguibacter inulinus TaxID=60922 RepID=A0A853ESC2_9MICO|nr:TetR family transcriptional regulator [Sanguibacter inulinus]MBF0721487.1 TetR family transcriptional regulator [Sanguibacter inulinus]NYS92632.1 TetR family transcriptional regulator [Sanguibacter inulinus]